MKRSLYETENTSVVAGLGLDLPTGSDVRGRVNAPVYTVHNETVLIQPFIGLLAACDDDYFFHGFLQVGVPLNGNQIDFQNAALGTAGTIGTYNDQTLLYVDLALVPSDRWIEPIVRLGGPGTDQSLLLSGSRMGPRRSFRSLSHGPGSDSRSAVAACHIAPACRDEP